MNRFRGILTALLLVSVAPGTGAAPAWTVDSDIGLSLRYNDNPGMRRNERQQDPSFGTSLTARARIARETQRAGIAIMPWVQQILYNDSANQDLENFSWRLNGDTFYRTPRSSYVLAFTYQERDLISSEFAGATDDPDLPPDSGTGSGSTRKRDDTRTNWSLTPQWSYDLSRKNQLFVTATYSGTRYEQTNTNRSDFDNLRVSVGMNHMLNQRHSISLSANAGNFESERKQPFTDFPTETPPFTPCAGEGLTSPCNLPLPPSARINKIAAPR